MNLSMIASLLGGIGLFLLGMRLMTDGLKYAAGHSLRMILEGSTSTRFRGILAGAFITSLVQSSGAVTVAAIGFVNAGLVDFAHAVSIIFGSNIGTTTTGWLVSLLGFNVNIMAFALPAVGLGVSLRVIYHEGRLGALGDVLTGFGVFFMGIDVLKNTFSGLGENIQLASLTSEGMPGVLIFVGIGLLLTFLMQSSSASIAIVLTAVAGNVIPLTDAAAAVIGANIGSTTTAALAVIGATPDGKRLAAAHVIFNVITGVVALLMLPAIINNIVFVQHLFGLERSPATLLALFHTSFNIFGVIIIYPMTNRLVAFLQKRWRTEDEDEALPKHLDKNIVATPILAIHALVMELKRIGAIARRMGQGAISSEKGPSARLKIDKNVIEKLSNEVGKFSNILQRSHLPVELDHQLPNALRVSGYFWAVAELAVEVATLQQRDSAPMDHPTLTPAFSHFKKDTVRLLASADNDLPGYNPSDCEKLLAQLKEEYVNIKTQILRAGTKGEISVNTMVHGLDLMARIRRIGEQAEKGARYLDDLSIAEHLPDGSGGKED